MKKYKIEGDDPNQLGSQSAKKLAIAYREEAPSYGILFLPRSWPCLLNILSLRSYLIPLKCTKIFGIIIRLPRIIKTPNLVQSKSVIKYQPNPTAMLIEIWKKIFHFLSMLSHCSVFTDFVSNLVLSIKFVCNKGLKTARLIISKINQNSKQIMHLKLVIAGVFYLSSFIKIGLIGKHKRIACKML